MRKLKNNENIGRSFLPMFYVCLLKSVVGIKLVLEPHVVNLKLLAVKIGKLSGVGCEVKNQLVGAKTLLFQSAFLVQLVCAVLSVT